MAIFNSYVRLLEGFLYPYQQNGEDHQTGNLPWMVALSMSLLKSNRWDDDLNMG